MVISEIQEIKEQFIKVIEFSQDLQDITVDSLFDNWLEAKRDIIEAFDGKLIYEVPEKVSFHLDDAVRKVNFSNFVDNINNVFQNKKLVDFLSANEEGFYTNTVPATYQNEDIKVPQGMKLVKAFKYFEKDQNLLTELQNQASQIIQEDKIEGRLCFSVHPLDYLSVSLNTYNWRSCHALDGDYRSGNLSYMIDKSTIVCYLKGENDAILPLFPNDVPWNSKKWRVLLCLSDHWEMIFAGRQYPFSSKSGLDLVRQYLLPALKIDNHQMTEWKNDYVTEYTDNNTGEKYKLAENYLPYYGELHKISSIIIDKDIFHFNDLLRSSCYLTPYYMFKHDYWWYETERLPQVNVGGEVKCLRCGKKRIACPDVMICPDCIDDINYDPDEQLTCDCCGGAIRNGNWQEVQGETICGRCIENECFVCDRCGEIHFNTNKKYDRKYDEYICTWCYAALRGEEE